MEFAKEIMFFPCLSRVFPLNRTPPCGPRGEGAELQQLELPEESGPATHHTEASMDVVGWKEDWSSPVTNLSQIKPQRERERDVCIYIYIYIFSSFKVGRVGDETMFVTYALLTLNHLMTFWLKPKWPDWPSWWLQLDRSCLFLSFVMAHRDPVLLAAPHAEVKRWCSDQGIQSTAAWLSSSLRRTRPSRRRAERCLRIGHRRARGIVALLASEDCSLRNGVGLGWPPQNRWCLRLAPERGG